MAGTPTGGDQPDPSAVPTILIGLIGTLVTILIVLFCQILFRVTERNAVVSEGPNAEVQAFHDSEAKRLHEGAMPIEEAMDSIVAEYAR
ncbi:MAG: hypothetical protein R3F62_30505 [Planctomycetota bacterium]